MQFSSDAIYSNQRNNGNDGLKSFLRVYELPDDYQSQQPFIERAEEDLLCAVMLSRHGACNYLPLVTVCYLLHQAIEKWLKLLIAVRAMPGSTQGQHDLYSRFTTVGKLEPQFLTIRDSIEAVNGEIMGHKFPGDLRYNEPPTDIGQYIQALMTAAFATRRLAKRSLRRLIQET